MMALDNIVIYPGNDLATVVTEAGSERVPVRVVRRFDDFSAALRENAPVEIRIDDGSEYPVPPAGTIVLCRPDVLERSISRQPEKVHSLSARTVFIDIVRGFGLEWCERLALAGAIESDQYFQWQAGQRSTSRASLYGLKVVGQSMGAVWSETSPSIDSYALLSHERFAQLPDLLNTYLCAYVQML
jgi:hypothetical protein